MEASVYKVVALRNQRVLVVVGCNHLPAASVSQLARRRPDVNGYFSPQATHHHRKLEWVRPPRRPR